MTQALHFLYHTKIHLLLQEVAPAVTNKDLKSSMNLHLMFSYFSYKQAIEVIANRMDIGEAIQECRTKTRQYAKRQITWFRREPDVNWLPGFGDEIHIQQQALEITQRFLSESSDAQDRS